MQSVASALLGDDVLLRPHAQGLMIILKDGEVDVADKEAINLLRWMRRHHLSIRALKGCVRTTCTWDHVMAMRKTLTPYPSKGRVLEVATKGGTRTCGVVEFHDIITTMVACAHAEDSIRKYEESTHLAVVIRSDATIFHNASATRCDVFVDLWEDRGAHHDGQAWASWWVFDGGDDMAHLQRMDAVGKLNDQVKKLEAEGGIEIGGTPKKLLFFKSGDGKVMMSGSCGKCWNCNLKYDQFQAHLFAIADFPVLPRIGSLMSCIPHVRNVGDVAHCCARVGTGIGRRLKDSARTWGSTGALRAVSHFISNLRQEAKHIPVAERVMGAPSKEKEHTLDINASRLFFQTPELHAELVRIVAMYCSHVVKWEGNKWLKTSAVLHLMLQARYYMQKIWRQVRLVPMDQRQRYASMVTPFTKAWGALGWSVPVWVHWVVCHSGAHLQRWGNFIKFSSIPTEWRNKSFKMDIRHCFQGWKLSKPYVTRWGLRHALHLDALDWGIRLWFGEKGLGREGIKFGMQRMRKKHRAPKHV